MKQLIEQHRIRYPPFEAARWLPESLPIAEQDYEIGEFASIEEAKTKMEECPPPFRLGHDRVGSWSEGTSTDEVLASQSAGRHLEEEAYVRLVKRQRRGWYLIPNPIHHILRQFINAVVIVLLASLFYLFVSPVLEALNVPVYGLETVRWGLLDYPALAVFIVPLIFAPLFIRVLANLIELRRQNMFLKRDLKTPIIAFAQPSTADEDLILNVEFLSGMTRGTTWMPSFESAFFRLQENHFSVPCNATQLDSLHPGSQRNCHTIGKSVSMTVQQEGKTPRWKSRK